MTIALADDRPGADGESAGVGCLAASNPDAGTGRRPAGGSVDNQPSTRRVSTPAGFQFTGALSGTVARLL